jgi:hypothetical protein
MEPFYVDIIQLRKFEIVFTQAGGSGVSHGDVQSGWMML